jgi:hypothetical protein
MSDKNDILRINTFKGQPLEVRDRIFLTLTAVEAYRVKRTAKAVALLLELLLKKRFVSDQELDDILYDCVT